MKWVLLTVAWVMMGTFGSVALTPKAEATRIGPAMMAGCMIIAPMCAGAAIGKNFRVEEPPRD